MDVKDLDLERTKREDDNTKVSVKDLLLYALDALNELPPEKLPDAATMLFVRRDPESGNIVYLTPFRCGLTRTEEVGVLTMHTHLTVEDSLT